MTNALTITNLSKTYPNGVQAVKGIDLTVQAGDFFALLGPNGAGKSTTIGIITSLVNKSTGSVEVFGHDITQETQLAKQHIGLVPQEFNFSIFEPVNHLLTNQAGYYGLPRKLAKQRIEKYLKKLSLWDKRDDRVMSLSGGMKRRLLIARALLHEPKLLILDEPTAGVDIEIRRTIWEFLKEINGQGTTVILTTHYLEEAENLCKNIAIINHGEIVENTSMKDLLRKLQRETIVLDLTDTLDNPPKIEKFACRLVDERTMEVDITHDQSVNELFAALSANDIGVRSLRNKANRLEELFLSMVDGEKS